MWPLYAMEVRLQGVGVQFHTAKKLWKVQICGIASWLVSCYEIVNRESNQFCEIPEVTAAHRLQRRLSQLLSSILSSIWIHSFNSFLIQVLSTKTIGNFPSLCHGKCPWSMNIGRSNWQVANRERDRGLEEEAQSNDNMLLLTHCKSNITWSN